MFRLHNMGLDMHHSADFSIERPNGSGDCLLIIFKTDALLTTDGRDSTVSPDTAIIYSEGTPQYYRAICGSYVNHFLHFGMEDGDADGRVIFDRLLTPGRVSDAEDILRMLSREQLSTSPNKDEYSSMLIKLLLMKVSEESDGTSDAQLNPHAEILDALRADIYANPGQFTSVAQLAERVRVSP